MVRAILAALTIAVVLYGIYSMWKASTWRQRWDAFRTMAGFLVVIATSVVTLAILVQLF